MICDTKTHVELPKVIVLDFDGVLHAYTSGWTRADEILDGPVEGALEFIRHLQAENFRVQIWSARSHQPNGIKAMKTWLLKYGLTIHEIHEIDFLTHIKPWFCVSIDDNAFRFVGKFPTAEEIHKMKQWNKPAASKPVEPTTDDEDVIKTLINQLVTHGVWLERTQAALEKAEKLSLQLCYQIEKSGASEELTKCSIMASNLHGDLQTILKDYQTNSIAKHLIDSQRKYQTISQIVKDAHGAVKKGVERLVEMLTKHNE